VPLRLDSRRRWGSALPRSPPAKTCRLCRAGVAFAGDPNRIARVPLSKNEKIDLLRRTALFAECTKAELVEVALSSDEREAPEGVRLAQEGRHGREFFILVEGVVSVRRGGRKLAELGPGDWFGEIAILTYKPRSATVTAISPVRLLVISDRAFRRVVEGAPRIALSVLRSVAARLEHDARS
jgi:CRP/FNR family transcriptional regulator, cyclic AMP receptor protein